MTSCELCGAPLISSEALRLPMYDLEGGRPDSPGPLMMMSDTSLNDNDFSDGMKLSFRAGGEKIFHERLKNAMIQRKWLLQDAPPVPKPNEPSTSDNLGLGIPGLELNAPATRPSAVGIAGLERRGLQTRKNNEAVIGNAFEDLEALMASAKEVVALAEKFAAESSRTSGEANTVLSQSAAALGMVTTKDMLGTGGKSENLYLSELSRNLAEYLTDDRNGILKREGGIMSLIDIWAVFNRSRNGVELISPADFQKAAELWEKLKLPVRLRRFKSGLLVVQRYDWSDEKTIAQLKQWLEELRFKPPDIEVSWDWQAFGVGVTAQEAARRFGWSVGVAAEELEMAEDKGVLCREESIAGLRFWSNVVMIEESSPSGGSTDTI
jgi:ESCRT-II complex subunit VPS36